MLQRLWAKPWVRQFGLFVLCLLVLLRTIVPTVYSYDSGEYAIGAARLGIIHAPGYALYLLIAHVFTLLPIGDVGFRVNLLSAVALALSAPVIYAAIAELVGDRWVALASTLTLIWSYYVWESGIRAEIYATQILTIALLGWMLALMYRRGETWRTTRHCLIAGVLFGLAVAMAPETILLAPGVVAAFLALRIPMRRCIYAGSLGAVIVVITLVYFPVRYQANPVLNLAGQYDSTGAFRAVDLRTPQGLYWLLRGGQFDDLFSPVPSLDHITTTASWFWGNYLGVGVLLGLTGIVVLWRTERGVLLCWLAFFLPFTYFFTAYGAVDRETMFGPSYLLWNVVFAYGLRWVGQQLPQKARIALSVALPVILLVVNFSLLDVSHDTSIRDHAQALLNNIPNDAVVFGNWFDIVPLQYLQMVEGQRPDVTFRNLFLFKRQALNDYLTSLATSNKPIIMVGASLPILPNNLYTATPIRLALPSFDNSQIRTSVGGYRLVPRKAQNG